MNSFAAALQYRVQTQRVITKGLTYEVLPEKEPKQERDSTTIRKDLFLQMLERTRGIVTACCDKVGIARATYYVWLNNDPKFKASVEEIMKMKADFLEDTVFVMAHKDFRAAKYLLEKIHPEFKNKPRDSKETTVNIYHHATPPAEKENDEIELGLDELFIMSEERDDLSQLTPMGLKTYKKYKQLAEFIKWEYGISDKKPKTKEDLEKEKNG